MTFWKRPFLAYLGRRHLLVSKENELVVVVAASTAKLRPDERGTNRLEGALARRSRREDQNAFPTAL
jgi:hypothetical protein